MKQKLLIFFLGIILASGFFIVSFAGAAPTSRVERTLLPEASSTYDLGSSTRPWRALYVDSCTGCGGGATTTINGSDGPAFTFESGNGVVISTSTPGLITFNLPQAIGPADSPGFASLIAGGVGLINNSFYGTAAGSAVSLGNPAYSKGCEVGICFFSGSPTTTFGWFQTGSLSDPGGFFDFRAPTADRTYRFPDASGTLALTSDITGGSPGGSTNEVQFNDGLTFAGSPQFTWDPNGNDAVCGGFLSLFCWDDAYTGNTPGEAFQAYPRFNITPGNNPSVYGLDFETSISGPSTVNAIYGAILDTSYNGLGTGVVSAPIYGLDLSATINAASSSDSLYGVHANVSSINGTTTSIYAGYFSTTIGGANVVDSYGLYVDSIGTATHNWALYTNGANPSYFGGNLGLAVTAPSSTLQIGTPFDATSHFLQYDVTKSIPASSDCNATTSIGRSILLVTTTAPRNRLYLCGYTTSNAVGWASSTFTN